MSNQTHSYKPISVISTLVLATSLGLVLMQPAQAVSTKPTITISQFVFSKLTAKAGSSILVRNKDQTAHTFHLVGTKIDPKVAAGKTITVKLPTRVGTYTIHCDFHPSMVGKLKITK